LAELAMQELTEQFNLVSIKHFEDFERNLLEEDVDDFMDVTNDYACPSVCLSSCLSACLFLYLSVHMSVPP
jgi:hypothetical protein